MGGRQTRQARFLVFFLLAIPPTAQSHQKRHQTRAALCCSCCCKCCWVLSRSFPFSFGRFRLLYFLTLLPAACVADRCIADDRWPNELAQTENDDLEVDLAWGPRQGTADGAH